MRLAAMVGVLVSCGASLEAQSDTADPRPTFSEAVQVVESELLVEVPRGAAIDQVEIDEGGALWPIDRHRPVVASGKDAEWHILVWFDAPLAAADRIGLAAQELAKQAEALTRLGKVEVVVADPAPARVLAPTRSALDLETQLLAIAAMPPGAGLQRRRFDALAKAKELRRADRGPIAARAVADEIALVRRQVDWLLLELEGGCRGEACVLIWVSDGWPLAPGELWRSVLDRNAPAPPGNLEVATAELAQLTAAWRWVVWPVSLEPPKVSSATNGGTRSDLDRWMDTMGAYTGQVGEVVLWRVAGASRDPSRPPPNEQDLAGLVSLDAAPLRALATATAGNLLSSATALDSLADRLQNFRRVWFRPMRELDGRLREVRLMRQGRVVEGLYAPRWSRSGTPQIFAELLLRRLLEGEDGVGTLEVTAERVGPATVRVGATLGAVGEIELEAAPPRWRVSWLQRGGAPQHRQLEAGAGLTPSIELEIAAQQGAVAVVVEDLVRRRRGTVLLRLEALRP